MASGRNLISWDNYKGFDPEVNAGGQSTVLRGIDFGAVPIPRTFSIGVSSQILIVLKKPFMIKINFYITSIISGLFLFSSCSKDYDNPNQPTYEETFTNERAATAVARAFNRYIPPRRQESLYAIVNANGFVTNELILRNAGNIPELQLFTGGSAVDATNTSTS